MKKAFIVGLLLMLVVATGVFAGPNYQLGIQITRMSSIGLGLIIMIDKPLPDNVQGSSYGWLLIKQENTAMILAAFVAYGTHKTIDIYTSGMGTSGFGEVSQLDLLAPQ
jgi:hypothetical protein